MFVYQGLPNGTNQDVADYQNIAPFFLNETFPDNWFRRGEPFTLVSTLVEALDLFLQEPRELGGNEGLNNFVPLELDLSTKTPAQLGCFLLENIFDIVPDQVQPAIAANFELFSAFVKGIIAPFFTDDGYFNCDISSFVEPSPNAGIDSNGSVSSSGSPVNGAYPGIGVIAPGSEPS